MRVISKLTLAAASILCVVPAGAQSIFGEIRGTVTDPSGAIVTAAMVTAKNEGTSELRKVSTDNAGNYQFVNLDAGIYEVAIESSGFRKSVIQNIVLRAREIVRADAKLELSTAATEVMVTEARQVIQLDSSTIVDSRTNDQLLKLPINFRAGTSNSIFSALSFAPGVQPNSTGSEISLSGSMPFQTTATIDGISTINVRGNGLIPEMFPSTEAIDELKLSSVSNNAEFAQLGDVTTTSRAGSNVFHGALFWYHQNGAMDARDFFNVRSAPFKVANDFGGRAGGPIKRNKTFFHFAEEHLRFRQQSAINQIVPPDSYRGGDLSSVTRAVNDPANGNAPFPSNIIPQSRISPQSAKTLELLFPRQNIPGNNIADPNLRLTKAAAIDNNGVDVRIDHNFNQKQNIFGRYSWKKAPQLTPLNDILQGDGRQTIIARSLTVAHNYLLRTNLVNEFRAGFADRPRTVDFGPNGQKLDGPAIVKQIGIQGLRSDPPQVASSPDFGISGFLGTAQTRGFNQISKTIQFTDNLTWTRGRHTFKFGADIRRLRNTDNVSFFSGDDLGEYRYNGMWTGNAFGDFLLGYPQRTRFANTGPDIDGSVTHQGYFAQDDWKITNKLTLNYGVRYELHPPFWDKTLQLANFDRNFKGGRVVVPNKESLALTAPGFRASIGDTPIVTAAEAGIPDVLRTTDKNNFMPRLGFAYRPWGNRTVIRGGYGFYTVTILGSVFYSLVGIHTSDTRTFTNSRLANGLPELSFPNPFGTGLGQITAVGNADFRRGNRIDAPDPYAQQWNLTVERDLGWNTGLRVTYQGSHSLKLYASPDLNQVRANTIGYTAAKVNRPFPNWAIVYSRDTGWSAKYNALLVELNRRFVGGLGFQASYAWTKNLTNATGSNGTGFAAENGSVPTDAYNLGLDYGNVSSTRRHRFLTVANYQLPYGRTGASSGGTDRVLKAVAGGWELSGVLLLQTGPFVTPITGGVTDPSGTNVDARANDRPDYAASVQDYGNLPTSERTIQRWWDRTQFTTPASNIGRFGYVGPNQLVGPGTAVLSAKLQKKFFITERAFLQVEGSFQNLLNHTNFGLPAQNLSAASFGRITSTQGAEGAGSRVAQVGMRLEF